jgi:amino acid adenylation domain-containing protein
MMENLNKNYELTPTQQAMLLYSLYAPKSRAYFEQVCYSYQGPLDCRAFAKAWQEVVDRHEILRAGFMSDESERPAQTVFAGATLPFQHHDWREYDPAQQRLLLAEFFQTDSELGFDLATPPLIRVAVLQTQDDNYWIVVSNHHIILDGWSMSVLRREVSQLYRQYAFGAPAMLEPPTHFGAYIAWLGTTADTAAQDFWRTELKGFAPANQLPIDKAAGKLPSAVEHFGEQQVSLSSALSQAIRSFARRNHLTLSTVIQAAWAVVLGRYCATNDVVFGITVSGRPYELPGIESLVGLLINTLPLRLETAPDDTCLSFLRKVQNTVAGLLEHEHNSLTQIHDWCDAPRNQPLFETLLVFENFAGNGSSFDLDGRIELTSSHLSRTNYPLTLVVEPGENLQIQAVYHEGRFDEAAIARLLGHLSAVLEGMIADADAPVTSLELLTAPETKTLLIDWNQGDGELDALTVNQPINRLFEQQAAETPDAIAVEHNDRSLTYSELNSRANQLAHHLKKLGVGPERLVGICVERSIEMLVAVMATLKAGGAYVPLDPTYPEGRLDFMLRDSSVQVLISQDHLLDGLPDYDGAIVSFDRDAALIESCESHNLSDSATAANLAYIIYTSGSTGNPKGTMIEHGSLMSFTNAAVSEYGILATDRVLQFASLNFDTSAEEIFPGLVTGATIVLRTDSMLSSARDFLRMCGEMKISVLDLPTAYWHELAAELTTDNLKLPDSLRLVVIGGEKALPERLASWRQRAGAEVRLLNTYGPTETTIVATVCDLTNIRLESNLEVPIGRPLGSAMLYVLDGALRPVPIGVPGELYIGGAGVARGYLNRAELTAQKFVANPFVDARAPRLYRTGDVVRYQADGSLEFLNRIDNQVKIRGFRVEAGEIEQAIRSHELVSGAIVLVREDATGDKRLVAYVVSNSAIQPAITELRDYLGTKLPAYMLPAAFVMLRSFPLLPNGKIDRRALPRPEQDRTSLETAFQAPRSPLEESVAKIWCDVLKLKRVGVQDNFFELGGHSLLGAKLISNLRRSLNCELTLIDVFQSPTVERLTQVIYQRQTESAAEEELSALLEELQTLSDEEAQKRLEQLVRNGGSLATALKLAVATGTYAALEILSYTL